jgi:hypothetical protein
MYAIGDQLMLHVYRPAVHGQIARSVSDRRQLQSAAAIPGVPQLLFAQDDGELLWLLEERIHGSSGRPGEADSWLPEAVDWLCRLAEHKGPPLRSTAFWDSHRMDTLEACPAELRGKLDAAWDRVGDVLATPLHGDVQPKNLMIGPHGIGLIDWEGMWLHGLPGHDILLLATMSGNDVPTSVVPDLLTGRANARGGLLRSALERCGYQADTFGAALLVTMSLWTLGETRRLRRDPATHRPTPFSDLLRRAMKDLPASTAKTAERSADSE